MLILDYSPTLSLLHILLPPHSLRHRTTVAAPKFASEFAIDAGHELAMFIWDEGRGHKLTEATYFCLRAPVDSHSLGGVNENGTAAAASSSSSKRGPTKSDAKGEKMSQCAVYSLGDDDDDEIDGDIDDCVTVEDSKEATCVSSPLGHIART